MRDSSSPCFLVETAQPMRLKDLGVESGTMDRFLIQMQSSFAQEGQCAICRMIPFLLWLHEIL